MSFTNLSEFAASSLLALIVQSMAILSIGMVDKKSMVNHVFKYVSYQFVITTNARFSGSVYTVRLLTNMSSKNKKSIIHSQKYQNVPLLWFEVE